MQKIQLASLACVGASMALTASASAASVFGPGTYRVGKDVRAGTYRTLGSGVGSCYWARLKGFSGSLGAIIANENVVGPGLVTILPTDKGFETTCRWTSNLRQVTKSKVRFGQGTYLVKTDILPGTYRTPGGKSCYWARLRAFTGGTTAIIANDNPRGPVVVTIAPSDRGFSSARCGTWSRV